MLETPGHKLLKRRSSLNQNNEQRALSSVDRSDASNSNRNVIIRETPLSKMPNAGNSTKKESQVFTNKSKIASKFVRRDSFYKANCEESCALKIQTPLKCQTSFLTEDMIAQASPFSLVFLSDKKSLVLTPAKISADFSDFEESNMKHLPDETPLRAGAFSILSNSGKKLKAFQLSSTLSLVDNFDKCFESPDAAKHDHLTRSTTKITQLNNILLSATKSSSAARKSLFGGKCQNSPQKFTAKSSFHDEPVYKITCEDSNSMDVLTEILNENVSQSGYPNESVSGQESYLDKFSFTLRRKPSVLSTEPIASGTIISSLFESKNSPVGGRRCFSEVGSRQKALEDLLRNPFTDSSPLLSAAESPA